MQRTPPLFTTLAGVTLTATLLAGTAAMTGCETTQTRREARAQARDRNHAFEASRLAYDDRLVGEWRTESGDRLVIRETKGQYTLDSTPVEGDPWSAPASLRMIGGGPIVELTITPAANKDAAPVMHYARLWVSERGRLIHQPLRAQWLNEEIVRSTSVREGRVITSNQTAQGVAALGSRAELYDLLRKAQQDRTAWTTPEVFTRVP